MEFDVWDLLPNEQVWEILSYITSLSDIINCLNVCRRFRYLIQAYSTKITGKGLSCPLIKLNSFRNLTTIDSNIFIDNSIFIPPKLIFARFLFPEHKLGSFDSFLNASIKILTEIQLFNGDFKIFTQCDNVGVCILIQKGKIALLGFNRPKINPIKLYRTKMQNFIKTIFEKDERLMFFCHDFGIYKFIHELLPEKRISGVRTEDLPQKLIKTSVLRFISDNDFGLIEPQQSPYTEINILRQMTTLYADQSPFPKWNNPLSDYLKELAASGLINANMLADLIYIYFVYHELFNGSIVNADDNIKITFNEMIESYNKNQIFQKNFENIWKRTNIDINTFHGSAICIFADLSTCKYLDGIDIIHDYEIPSKDLSIEDFKMIEDIVNHAASKYKYLRKRIVNNPTLQYYRSDGSTRNIKT